LKDQSVNDIQGNNRYVFRQVIRNISLHSAVKMHRSLMLHKVVHTVITEHQ